MGNSSDQGQVFVVSCCFLFCLRYKFLEISKEISVSLIDQNIPINPFFWMFTFFNGSFHGRNCHHKFMSRLARHFEAVETLSFHLDLLGPGWPPCPEDFLCRGHWNGSGSFQSWMWNNHSNSNNNNKKESNVIVVIYSILYCSLTSNWNSCLI